MSNLFCHPGRNRRRLIGSILLVLPMFVACGDETTINQTGLEVVGSADDLPKCSAKNKGEQVLVTDDAIIRVCVDGEWLATKSGDADDFSCKTVELKDGSGLKIVCNGDSIGVVLNGSDGKDGKSGKDGKDGEDAVIPQDTLENDSERVAISLDSLVGYTQKGPFLKGSTVYLYELSDGRTLKQTNGNFTSNITRDDGRYKFNARDLVSQYAMIVVDGYYRNEVTGKTSDAPIRLKAITDMRKRSSVNVNILTHLEFERVYQLVTRGDKDGNKLTVKQAKRQAQKEILEQFHIKLDDSTDAEDMDVFGSSDADAVLLAVSALLQGDSGTTDLSVLLTEISNNIAEFGEWKNDSAKTAIADWAMVADNDDRLGSIAKNVTNWGLGDAPDFAKYVRDYWKGEKGIEDCSSAIEGKVIATRDDMNKYYCSENSWIKPDGWSWDYPKEIYYNTQIEYDTMIDPRDKKVYRIVTIGSQTWMAENLNYADSSKTLSLKGKSWCFYNTAKNCDVGGRLYTWAAAIDSVKFATAADKPQDCGYGKTCTLPAKVQGVCPEGWHLPSMSEWDSLSETVGVELVGLLLKSQAGWLNNGNGTDAFGFAALPAGFRIPESGNFHQTYNAYFWSSADFSRVSEYNPIEYNADEARVMNLIHDNNSANRPWADKRYGLSVRCLRD